MKLTPWFPAILKPARYGWYQTRGYCIDSGMPLFWNGEQWGYWEHNSLFEGGVVWITFRLSIGDEWRGLAHPPKKGK